MVIGDNLYCGTSREMVNKNGKILQKVHPDFNGPVV